MERHIFSGHLIGHFLASERIIKNNFLTEYWPSGARMLGLLTFNRVVDLYHEKHNSGLPLRLEYNTVVIKIYFMIFIVLRLPQILSCKLSFKVLKGRVRVFQTYKADTKDFNSQNIELKYFVSF